MRHSNRQQDELRVVKITPNNNKYAEGSVLVEFGDTKVICTATVETRLPPWMRAQGMAGKGWVTAEYGMLPRSTETRMDRETKGQKGRTQEIQRLISRSLRSVVDLKKLGEIQIKIDCDVIQADGGTRVSSICGAFVALKMAMQKIGKEFALKDSVAAVSCGVLDGQTILDLDYKEDSAAEVDANFVITGSGNLVEVQSTGEENTFTEEQLFEMLALAKKGIKEITEIQNQTFEA